MSNTIHLDAGMNGLIDFGEDKYILVMKLIFLISFVVQIFYWLYFYLKFVISKPSQDSQTPPVSVIIAARNEEENLKRFLDSILTQDYPNYEVIVVNHASTDATAVILKQLEQKYSHLYTTHIPYSEVSNHTKKFALMIGIKAAKNDVLLFTDADCQPVSNQWIRKMVQHFDQQTQIVIGYGGYKPSKGLLDKYVRTDTAFIAMQYFGFGLRGLPYMGVGRNLAWRKSFFLSKGGFSGHSHEPSGADDIFVNHFASKKNTKFEFDPSSFTRSVQPASFKHFFQMKRRHFGSTRFYKRIYKIILSLEPLSRVFFYLSFVLLILSNLVNQAEIILGILREILIIIIFYINAKKLAEKQITAFFVIYDILQPFVNLYLYFTKTWNKKQLWM